MTHHRAPARTAFLFLALCAAGQVGHAQTFRDSVAAAERFDAQYAAALERRTALPLLPDFDFTAMMRAHYTGPVVILPRHLVALDETGTEAAA